MSAATSPDSEPQSPKIWTAEDEARLSADAARAVQDYERIQKEFREDARLLRMYGITLADYERLYDEQAGCCAVCDVPHDRLHVDHCHRTKRVRGLLCQVCNQALGRLGDTPWRAEEIARRYQGLADYLYRSWSI